jgi:hypothetical protein
MVSKMCSKTARSSSENEGVVVGWLLLPFLTCVQYVWYSQYGKALIFFMRPMRCPVRLRTLGPLLCSG